MFSFMLEGAKLADRNGKVVRNYNFEPKQCKIQKNL